jgi:hypothetical protein
MHTGLDRRISPHSSPYMQEVHMHELLHWTMGMLLPSQVAEHFLALQIKSVLVQVWA